MSAEDLADCLADVEDAFWREHYFTRPYVDQRRSYERYRPAYRFGWEARLDRRAPSFAEAAQDLEAAWEENPPSDLGWQEARPAVADAWRHADRMLEETRLGSGNPPPAGAAPGEDGGDSTASGEALTNALLANQLRLAVRLRPLVEHQLRGVLNSLSLNVSLLEATLPTAFHGSGEAREQAAAAVTALRQGLTRDATKITETLAATAPRLSRSSQLFDLAQLLRETTELLSLEARRTGCQIALELPAESVPIEGGQGAVQQVISNLVLGLLDRLPLQARPVLTLSLQVSSDWAEVVMTAPARPGRMAYPSSSALGEPALLRALSAEVGGELLHEPTPEGQRLRFRIPLPIPEE